MSAEARQRWMEHKAGEVTREFDMPALTLLPLEVRAAIDGLVAEAFKRGYNWGFHEGRACLATGREPTYAVPKPALEIAIEPRDVA